MSKKRERPPHAMYRMTWYDWEWNELASTAKLVSAHDMVESIEAWNRRVQGEARLPEVIISDPSIPIHVSVEVIFV
jgi:hypothetical protein